MSDPVWFNFNWRKAIEAIVWIADRKPNIGPFHIAKILFFADKAHLQRHARPILGDTYIAMRYGPVPSGVHDIIDRDSFLEPDTLEAASEAFEVVRDGRPEINALRAPDLSVFSATDLDCLEWAFERYSDMPFGRLTDLAHREKAHTSASPNSPIDYALMIDDDVPDRDELLEEIRQTAAYVVI